MKDFRTRCAQPPGFKPKFARKIIRSFRSNLGPDGRILHFPTPDYSGIPRKVDCWRENWKIRGSDVRENSDGGRLDHLILFASHSIYAYFAENSIALYYTKLFNLPGFIGSRGHTQTPQMHTEDFRFAVKMQFFW
jgi:hypothetical protein